MVKLPRHWQMILAILVLAAVGGVTAAISIPDNHAPVAAAKSLAAIAAPSVYISPNGNDANACTQTAPCKTFRRGYAAAPAGSTVEAAGGYYGCESISGTKTSAVTFVPAAGEVPKITCELTLSTTNIAFRDMQIAGIRSTGAQYTTLNNVDITCQDSAPYKLWGGKCSASVFLFAPTSHFYMTGGSVGPTWDDTYDGAPGQGQIGINLTAGDNRISSDLNFDGVRFHDNRRIDDTQHTSCLMVGGGDGVTIRNSKFENCAVFDLFFTWWHFGGLTYPPGTNITVQNNVFNRIVAGCSGCPVGYFAIDWADYQPTWANVLVKGNSLAQAMGFTASQPVQNFAVTENTGERGTCKSGVSYSYNIWSDGKQCGPTDGSAAPGTTTGTTPTTTAPTTTAPTTTAPTTTDSTPPPPQCGTTCDDQIASLKQQLADAEAQLQTAESEKSTLNTRITTLQDAINKMIADGQAVLSG